MKKLAVILLLAIGMGLFLFHSCQKEQGNKAGSEIQIIANDDAMAQHIISFKEKMNLYKLNPGLKSEGGGYTAPEGIIELENLLNFDFCYTSIECDKKIFITSEVIMPLDDLSKINDPRLSQLYYEEIIDTIQAQMGRVDYPNMKLLLVDLELNGYNSSLDAIIKVGSLIGSEQQVILHNDNWWYGQNHGDCNGLHAPEDAASQLDARVTQEMNEPAPSGCRWYFTAVQSFYIVPTQDQLPPPIDNYIDYKIFYAIENFNNLHITDTESCLSAYEMAIYEDYYIEYAEYYENTYNKKFDYCLIEGNPYSSNTIIQHDYYIYIGNRGIECTAIIENILEY